MPSTRLIPPYRARGLYAATATLGLVLGPIAGLIVLYSALRRLTTTPVTEIAQVFIIPVIFITIFAMRCQRLRPVFLTALLFGFTYWISFITAQNLAQRTSGGASLLAGFWLAFLIAAASIALMSAIAALLLRWLVRLFIVRYVEQTGQLCHRCAYAVDPATQPLCPECGASTTEPPTRGRPLTAFLQAARLYARPALAIVLLLELAIDGFIIANRGYPIYRFQSAVATEHPYYPGGSIEGLTPDGKPFIQQTAGAWVAFPGSTTQGVIAGYLPTDEPGFPAMQLSVYNHSGPHIYFAVSPEVICTLSRAQAESAIRDGLPESLLKAIEAAVQSNTAQSSRADRTIIDPAPYFER